MSRQPGVVIGVVKDVNDPQGEGRIQLTFPWQSGEQTSNWAPVAAALAGTKRGAFFMPEKDDEVLVAFDHGDTDHPYIVGFLWNGRNRPPESDLQNRVIVTPGGHTLRFEDGAPNKKIILRSSSGHQIVLDDSPGGQSVSIKTNGGLSLTLDDKTSAIELRGGGRTLAMRGGQLQIT